MRKEELRFMEEVERDFNMSKINKNFKTFAQMQEELKNAKVERLYPRICNFNQRAVLMGFMKKLSEKFGDKLLIDTEDMVNIELILSSKYETEKNRAIMAYGYKYTLADYLTFAIGGYIYYIQFDDNPLFEDSSFITTSKIYKLDGFYVKPEYYGTSDDFNINGLIKHEYDSTCDIEKSAENLLNYFLKERYNQEGLRYHGENERLTQYLEDGTSHIITLEGKEK